jgi:glycerol-3-phosphate cytidylyltransferase
MGLRHKELLDMHVLIVDALEKNHIKYVVYGGVMLGLHRDNNLLEWDMDIDYGFFQEDFQQVKNILESIYTSRVLDISPKHNGHMLKIKNNVNDVMYYLDFKFFKNTLENTLVFDADDLPNYPIDFILKSKIKVIDDIAFRLSTYIEEWIVFDYGSNWETPIKEYAHNDWISSAKDTWKVSNIKAKQNKKGLTCGTFDLFHKGHVNILKKSTEYCTHLTVALSTDELILQYKNKNPFYNYAHRKIILDACRYVDAIVPQIELDKETLIETLDVDYLFVGSDWKGTPYWNELAKKLTDRESKCKIIYFSYTLDVSSTIMNKAFLKNKQDIADSLN